MYSPSRAYVHLKFNKISKEFIAIDGCDKDCAKIILNKPGYTHIKHLQLGMLGMKKGESPVTEERVEQSLVEARKLLTA